MCLNRARIANLEGGTMKGRLLITAALAIAMTCGMGACGRQKGCCPQGWGCCLKMICRWRQRGSEHLRERQRLCCRRKDNPVRRCRTARLHCGLTGAAGLSSVRQYFWSGNYSGIYVFLIWPSQYPLFLTADQRAGRPGQQLCVHCTIIE